MTTDDDASSNFTPPDGLIPFASAVRWAAFDFALSVRIASQYLENALMRGILPAWRATELTAPELVPLSEVALWDGRPGRRLLEATGRWAEASEQFLVCWVDVRTILAQFFFELLPHAPWPAQAALDAWADIPEAVELLSTTPALRHLRHDTLRALVILAICLKRVAVGRLEGGTAQPVVLGPGETWCIQQGQDGSRHGLTWNWRRAMGDPNCEQPYVPSLLAERWANTAAGPTVVAEGGADRIITEPVVHVPTLIATIRELSHDWDRLRHVGVEMPPRRAEPQPVKVTEALAQLAAHGKSRAFTTAGGLASNAARVLAQAIASGAIASWIEVPGVEPHNTPSFVSVPVAVTDCLTISTTEWTAAFDWDRVARMTASQLNDPVHSCDGCARIGCLELRGVLVSLARQHFDQPATRVAAVLPLMVRIADVAEMSAALCAEPLTRAEAASKSRAKGGRTVDRSVLTAIEEVSASIHAHGIEEHVGAKAAYVRKLQQFTANRGGSIGNTQGKRHINKLLKAHKAALEAPDPQVGNETDR